MRNMLSFKYEIALLLLFLVGFGFRVYDLDIPKDYYFDEIYYAFTAQEMAKGNREAWESWNESPEGLAYEWTHPPLGKELIAAGILIFGDNTFGWRIIQALFGALGTIFIYLLAKNLFRIKSIGLIAAFLYLFESFIFVLSRIAMVDIFLLNFILLATLFLVNYANSRKGYYLALCGLFSGAAMSIKWSGVYVAEFLTLNAFILIYYFEIYSKKELNISSMSVFLKSIVPKMILFFIIIPLAVYMFSYIPFFVYGNSFDNFLLLQGNMFGYHQGVTGTHPYQSNWWQWPLMLKPVFVYLGDFGEKHRYIYMIGNPLIWWSGVVFLLLAIVRSVKNELISLGFAVLCVFAYWLPWVLSPRKMSFMYHYMPSFIFIIVISAYFLDLIWKKYEYGKYLVGGYLLLVLGLFIFYYPILVATPLFEDELWRFFWISGWR